MLDDISVEIPAGSKVGIVGRTGRLVLINRYKSLTRLMLTFYSGKSSVLMALLGFLDYTGRITIDGVDISKISLQKLRSVITAISQDDFEFEGTVRYNLCPVIKGSEASEAPFGDETVLALLKELNLFHLLDKKKGLDTELSKMKLSHGQKQLMSIARSCVRNFTYKTRIVVMDEATSNLDHKIEAIVLNAIREVFTDCTVIMVAHRTETLKDASLVIELADGKLHSMRHVKQPNKMKTAKQRRRVMGVPGQSGLFPKADTPRPRPNVRQPKERTAAEKLREEIVASAEKHIKKLREQARVRAMKTEASQTEVKEPTTEEKTTKKTKSKKSKRKGKGKGKAKPETEKASERGSDLEKGVLGKGKERAG